MTDETYTASIVGGTGFTGGELLRILGTSRLRGRAGHVAVGRQHDRRSLPPESARARPALLDPDDLESVDVLFSATPHGVSMGQVDEYFEAADTVVDLSADFRLPEAALYDEWYDGHTSPEYLERAEYALPEINRENLSGADLIAGGGCNATATMLGLKPLVDAGALGPDTGEVVVDVKVGSSEGRRRRRRGLLTSGALGRRPPVRAHRSPPRGGDRGVPRARRLLYRPRGSR